MTDIDSLWGEEFNVPNEKEKIKKIKEKITKPKEVTMSVEKQIKSKKVSWLEKTAAIRAEVLRVLGKQQNNIICIKTFDEYMAYIDKAVVSGRIAVDTETDNRTDTVTCQLMGLCLYVKGEKQAYIPVNHVDPDTLERLPWQLNEEQIRVGLQRLITKEKINWSPDFEGQTYIEWLMSRNLEPMSSHSTGVDIIMHNADFDYQVIKKTCNITLPVYWDTMIAAQVINENEHASLKEQYINKIDPDQEKYSINHLFEGVPYAKIDPEVFAFYAATDALMTDRLYEWQVERFKDTDLNKVYKLYRYVESPVTEVVSKMEMRGVNIDKALNDRLSIKYHQLLDDCDNKIAAELSNLSNIINAWKLSREANEKSKTYQSEKSKVTAEKALQMYPEVDPITGKRYKIGKSKVEQLTDPINLASPTQLAILFYDILKAPVVDKKQPRATGEDAMEAIASKTDLAICKLIIERRGIVKLLSTYIDNIPELLNFWSDGKIRTHFKQYGAATGRFSSGGSIKYMDAEGNNKEISGTNMQNIPAQVKELRMQFTADSCEEFKPLQNNYFEVSRFNEIKTTEGWLSVNKLTPGNILVMDSGEIKLKNIEFVNNMVKLYV